MLSDASSPQVQALLRQILDGTNAGVAMLDPELRYTYVNRTLARMNGVPAEQHTGRTIAEVVPDIDAREDVLRQVLADGVPREVTSSGHTRAGSERERRYWHGAYHRLEENGQVIGIFGIVLEVTDAREHERELERAQARLSVLDRAATVVGTTLDMDTTCNELAGFLVPYLADIATVDVVPSDVGLRMRPPSRGVLRLRRTAVAAVPDLEARVRSFGRPGEYLDHQPGSAVRRCLAAGEPVLENLLDDEALLRSAPTPGRLAAYRELGYHSGLLVPLLARGEPVGTLTLVRAGDSPAFTDHDVVTAQDLAGRAAISLDNARRYTREHHIALELQRALLSGPSSPHPALEVASRYLPSGTSALVGGDWFDSVQLSPHRTLLVIGDVMGHGVEAAVDMSHYSAMVRVVAEDGMAPHLVLDRMDALMARVSGERPATCLLALVDTRRGVCTYAGAGHLPPAVIDIDHRTHLLNVPTGPPLGTGFGGYVSWTRPCLGGDTLLLYTDGLVERRGEDIDHSLLRLARLRLPRNASLDLLLDRLLAGMGAGGTDVEDDVAVLAARIRPEHAGPTAG
ncbi:SpoIIE family protein phosphatase [Streptacidiphilus albus]|uniref:SpoIIE family protein phosphatase n=1 Tax=Streptacidiphilus albus TaxID=105425 RepID=UPI00054C1E9C|nr:SpoIIE family protein phosphatase [Streptacidiphilus albus]